MRRILKLLILPPGGNLVLALLGWLILLKKPWLGKAMIILSMVSLVILSLPVTSRTIRQSLETIEPLPQNLKQLPDLDQYQAIVILGGGRYYRAPEYGFGDTASPLGLVRLRYGAYLWRELQKPILVTGGKNPGEQSTESEFMENVLGSAFNVPVAWQESQSQTTYENAVYSKILLARYNIDRIILVTHAWHMPRALWAFEQAGFKVLPAPTGFSSAANEYNPILDFIPSSGALRESTFSLHEYLGHLWYRIAHG